MDEYVVAVLSFVSDVFHYLGTDVKGVLGGVCAVIGASTMKKVPAVFCMGVRCFKWFTQAPPPGEMARALLDVMYKPNPKWCPQRNILIVNGVTFVLSNNKKRLVEVRTDGVTNCLPMLSYWDRKLVEFNVKDVVVEYERREIKAEEELALSMIRTASTYKTNAKLDSKPLTVYTNGGMIGG